MTKHYFSITFLFLLMILLLPSCGKDKTNSPIIPPVISPPAKTVHVYVSGYDYANNHVYAKYWKDGKSILLSDTTSSQQQQANAIAVSPDSTVHIAGIAYEVPYYPSMKYWKDNMPFVTIDNYSLINATGIAISDINVYISGTASDATLRTSVAEYWENGKVNYLYSGNAYSYATGIAVSLGNVYVAINVRSTNGNYIAGFSKNGIATILSDSTVGAEASAIIVSGSDVYVAGYLADAATNKAVAAYWKNGKLVLLGNSSFISSASGISISGTDVYVCGVENDNSGNGIAKYWKNGVAVNLGIAGTFSSTSGIAISGNDVYVSGRQTSKANYWKNGVSVDLSGGSTLANTTGIAIQ